MKNIRYMQTCTWNWVINTFGFDVSETRLKGFRFLEEAVELVESLGLDRDQCHKIVDFVFDRNAPGEPMQEIGGVMMTLGACASANELDIETAWQDELSRCTLKSAEIKAKDDLKPKDVKA